MEVVEEARTDAEDREPSRGRTEGRREVGSVCGNP